uniref:Uncharacterized protein n=1 Tax=Glossina brevipalpis TaxID=37001 RepID=A0A1A9WNE3_9MUSC
MSGKYDEVEVMVDKSKIASHAYKRRLVVLTAVLLTRKAQAALKRPAETPATPVKEENTNSSSGDMAVSDVPLMSSMNSAMTTSVVAAAALGSPALSISNKYSGGLNQLTPLSASLSQVTTSLAGMHGINMRNSASMSPKKSPKSAAVVAATHAPPLPAVPPIQTPPAPNLTNYERMPDKFRTNCSAQKTLLQWSSFSYYIQNLTLAYLIGFCELL